MQVQVNLNGVFAQIESAKELKETANNIMQQIKAAYDVRLAEIMPKAKGVKNGVVAISATPTTKGKKAAAKNEFEGVPEADTQKAAPTKKAAKETKATTEKAAKVEQVKIASLTKAQIKAMNIYFEQYSEKCMLMIGETKPIKEDIKENGWARWYSKDGRQGWMVKNDYAQQLAKALKIKLA